MDCGHDCEKNAVHSEEYDAYYCESCNKWLEDKCDDAECEFCVLRPDTPMEIKDDNAR
jgi:hypothetical protein